MILFMSCLMLEVKIVIIFGVEAGSEWKETQDLRLWDIDNKYSFFLSWVLIIWVSSISHNLLSYVLMIHVLFVYINTNLQI